MDAQSPSPLADIMAAGVAFPADPGTPRCADASIWLAMLCHALRTLSTLAFRATAELKNVLFQVCAPSQCRRRRVCFDRGEAGGGGAGRSAADAARVWRRRRRLVHVATPCASLSQGACTGLHALTEAVVRSGTGQGQRESPRQRGAQHGAQHSMGTAQSMHHRSASEPATPAAHTWQRAVGAAARQSYKTMTATDIQLWQQTKDTGAQGWQQN